MSADRDALLARIAACDDATLVRLARLLEERANPADSGSGYLAFLDAVAASDVAGLKTSEKSYGNSWKLRGGVDTYHMLRRKWERLESSVSRALPAGDGKQRAEPYDIFEHLAADRRADGFIDDIRDLRRYLMLTEAETLARAATPENDRGYLDQLEALAKGDIADLLEKEKAYGASWKKAGGIGAFMMFARKWDRIKQRVSTRVEPTDTFPAAARENILEHIAADRRTEPVLDDIRDLRRYLLLVEAEMAARGAVEIGSARDNRGG